MRLIAATLALVCVMGVATTASAAADDACTAPDGADAGEVLVGGLTATRIESQGSGMGRWASWEHDRWLVFKEPTCRLVGLRVAGGAGSVFASAHFMSTREQGPPSKDEQQALLSWAGHVPADEADPRDALRTVPWLPVGPDPASNDAGEPLRCSVSPVVPLARARVAFVSPRTSWKEETWSVQQLAESDVGNYKAACPCFSVLQGEQLKERTDAPSVVIRTEDARMTLSRGRRVVDLATGARNMTHALGLLDDKGRVLWFGMNYGPVQHLGAHEDRLWFQTLNSPLDDGQPNILRIDLRARTAQSCRLHVPEDQWVRLEGTPGGIALHASPDDGAPPRVVSFAEMQAAWLTSHARSRIVWRELQDGLAYAAVPFVQKPVHGDGVLHVVKIDPARAPVQAFASSAAGGDRSQTAASWAKQEQLAVVINAGMYETDHQTHTGHFRLGDHINSTRWLQSYKSALVVSRFVNDGARLVDLEPNANLDDADADVVVQNLRLIKAPGVNVWPENHKQWSEAAVALTRTGDILFLFSRSPLSMREFNTKLLSAGLDVVRAMHVEGGPEASLSIHAGGIDLDLSGSYETGFFENDDNREQWPIPNILGVRLDARREATD